MLAVKISSIEPLDTFGAMENYRCYLLDRDLRIRNVRIIEGADDEEVTREALGLLMQMDAYAGIELWLKDRHVFTHRR